MRSHKLTAYVFLILWLLSGCLLPTTAEQAERVKVAEGEYLVSLEGDLGVGPIDTEVFHFRESWTLWRTTGGEYEIDGDRMFESPRGIPHDNRFIATLSHDLRLLELKEFARLKFRRDSGPRRGVVVKVSVDLPYGVTAPLSAFFLAGLTGAASPQVDQPSRIQVVRLEEVSNAIPVLPIRSDGLIRYFGQSKTPFTASGKSWHPKVYELTTSPVRKMQITTSPEGLLLTAKRPGWPKGKMELVRFTQFADF